MIDPEGPCPIKLRGHRMKTLAKTLFAFLLFGPMSSAALAQFRGSASLIYYEDVQQELKISKGQKENLDALSQRTQERYREEFRKARTLAKDQRVKRSIEISVTMNSEIQTGLVMILKPEQRKRL